MSKAFWLGFGFAILLVCALGLSPIYVTHSSQQQTDTEFRNVYALLQPKELEIKYSTPAIGDLEQKSLFLMKTGDLKLAMRSDNWLFYVKLSS